MSVKQDLHVLKSARERDLPDPPLPVCSPDPSLFCFCFLLDRNARRAAGWTPEAPPGSSRALGAEVNPNAPPPQHRKVAPGRFPAPKHTHTHTQRASAERTSGRDLT